VRRFSASDHSVSAHFDNPTVPIHQKHNPPFAFVTILLACLVILGASPANAQVTATVSETYVGTYSYGADCANYTGQETLVLSGTSAAITGTVSDVVTSPVAGADHGTVSGTVSGSNITLTSSYVSGLHGTLNGTISGGTITGTITGICTTATVSLSLTQSSVTVGGTLPPATSGTTYNLALPPSGPFGPNVWSASGLPPGFSMQNDAIVSSGSPAATAGTYNVSLTVTEAGATGSATLPLVVGQTSLEITTKSLAAGVWQTASLAFSEYSATLFATGGTPPYTWAVTGLPNSLSVDSASGGISGTFAEDSENTSSFDRIKRQFTIFVSVSDSVGATASSVPPLTIDFTCGGLGDEDLLIQQYVSLGVYAGFAGIIDSVTSKPFAPRCMDITRSGHSQNYRFPTLNRSNRSDGSVALLANSLLTGQGVPYFLPPPLSHGPGLDGWVGNFGSVPTLTSGFRPPLDQVKINSTAPSSRHMFGDAVDLAVIQTGTTAQIQARYNALVNAALDAGADFTETDPKSIRLKLACSPAVMTCVHADWRFATSLFGGSAPYAQ
jgi:hypothetical protein